MAPVEGFLFDFDGTLVHLPVDWQGVKSKLLALARQENPHIRENTPLSDLLLAEGALRVEALSYLQSAELEAAKNARAIEGAPELLAYIAKRRIPYGIVSQNFHSTIEQICDTFEWEPKEIIGKDDVSQNKPHPEGTALALKGLGCKAENVWAIGDRDIDMKAFKAAGIERVSLVGSQEYPSLHSLVAHITTVLDTNTNS